MFIHSTIILLSALCVEVTVAGAKNAFPSFNFPSFVPFFNLCTPLCHTVVSYVYFTYFSVTFQDLKYI